MSGLGRSHHQVLHVPPGQVHTARTQKGKQSRVHLLSAMYYLEVLLSTFMHIMRKARFRRPKLYEEKIRGALANGKGQESVDTPEM